MYKFYSQALSYSLALFAFSLPLSKAALSIFLGCATLFFILKKCWTPKNKKQSWISHTSLNKPILYFLVFCILSLLWGNYFSTHLRGIVKFIEGFLLLFIILDTFETPKAMAPLLYALLLGGVVTSLNGITQFYLGYGWWFIGGPSYGSRIISTFKDPTMLSAYLALILPLLFIFFKTKMNLWHKFMYAIGFSSILFAFYLSYSNNILFFLLSSAYVVFFLFNKKISTSLKVLSISCMLILAIASFPKLKHNTSLLERLHLWKISIKMIQDAPVLGHGLNSYSKINRAYFPPRPQDMPYAATYLYLAYPHNSYLKLWIEIGLVGLLLYLFIYYCFFRYALRITQMTEGKMRFNLSLYFLSILTFLASTFFDTFLESTQSRILFWLIMGLMMVELRETEQTIQSEKVLTVVPETNVLQGPADALQT